MADHGSEKHDGRFGKRFDEEVSVPAILWTTIGLALACGLGMLVTWSMQGFFANRAGLPQPSPIAEANERRLPEGPLLQADPEQELEAMREELAERLEGYGWIDEGTGVVHIPIDKAMDLVAEQAVSAAPPADAVGEPAAEEPVAEEASE